MRSMELLISQLNATNSNTFAQKTQSDRPVAQQDKSDIQKIVELNHAARKSCTGLALGGWRTITVGVQDAELEGRRV